MDFFNNKKLAIVNEKLENANRTLLERDLLSNALGVSHGGDRDIYTIYGYPQRTDFNLLYKYSRREGIANRIVFGLPKSCWSDGFKIFSDEEETTEILEDELNQLNRKMLSAFERADALNRIGKFSVLFVGVPDGLEPSEPLGRVRGDAVKSVYFKPFAYDGVTIAKYDTSPMSPRCGMPEIYQLQVMGRGDDNKTIICSTINAHYTRVVHIVENMFDSEVEGLPALEPIFNNILNIEKTTGGSAEAYFRNADGKFSFEIDKDFSSELINNAEAKDKFDAAAKNFTNKRQNQIIALGSKVTSHVTPTSSPLDTVKVNLWEISAQTKLPIRILTGEGGGQLAGSEDKLAYNVIVDDRQSTFCDGVVHDAFSILNDSGVLTLPDEYYIGWTPQEATTDAERAEVGFKRSQTIKNLMDAGSTAAGDGLDIESAFEECYLNEVEVDKVDIDIDTTPPETPPMTGAQ